MHISELLSPCLLIEPRTVERNIAEMVRMAGSPGRLRPHCKTHKLREIIAMELAHDITKHKCATLAEAEMLASCGVNDILLAYNLVGPNIARVVRLLEHYPDLQFACAADHPAPIAALSQAVHAANKTVDVLLDLDVGQHRTGIAPGSAALELYQLIAASPGLKPGGLHVYDGHNHQPEVAERRAAVQQIWRAVLPFRDLLRAYQLPVPRITAGGTPTFPIFAEIDDPAIELSPGTIVLHDAGYARHYPDLHFTPAARLMTRVISRPTANRLTLDLGHKAVAADPPAGQRLTFPALPDAKAVIHNEEHLVLETPEAARFQPGDILFAWPTHICPTCALHKEVYAVDGEKVIATWQLASRDRV
jgi:D-serine deaminase-like pyridoxal phosphate-dependent protein